MNIELHIEFFFSYRADSADSIKGKIILRPRRRYCISVAEKDTY